MREIKFRAWDKEGNESTGEEIGMISAEEWRERYSYVMPLPWKTNRYIFIQFTGLKDKNGKEIYEGDIINRGDYEPRLIQTVTYVYGGFSLYETKSSMPPEWDMEIIGNIYENPELLKGG